MQKVEKKVSYLCEDTLRTQRVGAYLNDLKDRLKVLRKQHDEVITNSVDIIKEINDVSMSLRAPSAGENQESMTRIKRLIRDFEGKHPESSIRGTMSVDCGRIEITKLLDNFEKLNESHVLRESLIFFKRAKESFEKIDNYLEKLGECGVRHQALKASVGNGSFNVLPSDSMRERINMFNKAATEGCQYIQRFSSSTSLDEFVSVEEIKPRVDSSTTNSLSQSGYEGDVDSEAENSQQLTE